LADVNAEINVNIDTSGALAQLKALQREISRFHTSVAKSSDAAALAQRDLQKNFINGVSAIRGFSAELRTVKTTAENFTDSLERNKFSMREYFRYSMASTKTFGRMFSSELDTVNKVAVENVKRLQTQYIKMGRDATGAMKAIAVMPTKLDMTNLTTQTQLAAQRQAIFNQLVKQGSTNLLNFGKNTQWAGRQLMVGFTIPLMGLGAVATKTFMQMETAAIKFKKVYGDLFTAPEETQFALESIQMLGQEFTKYGIAVADTVGLAAEAAAAGFSGADLQAQVTQATRLQVLGQVEQQRALETTISLQNAFRIASTELADAINFLNAVENQTVVSLDDITTAIPKAAPIVRELGGDVKDLAFFMAAMKEGGINAAEGANALKSGLASLINPTDKAKGMLSAMGIDIDRIVESNVGNLKATVIEFAKALDGLSNLQRQRAIEQLFGKFQQARLSALFDNVIRDGNQASRVLDLASASMEELASLAEKELGLTADSAMNKFRSSVEQLKLSLAPVGEVFLQIVTPLLDKLNGLLQWFNSLPDSTKKAIAKVTLYLGGLAPVLLMTIGLLANFVANGIKGLNLLRNGFLRLTGQSKILGEQTQYLTVEQQNAVAAAASLEQSHMRLQQAFTGEAVAVRQLIAEYQRMIAAQNTSATRFPGMMAPGFKAKGYANGIMSVPGPKGAGDIVPAMVSPGEAIISTAMNKKYAPLVQGIIADNIPGYQNSRFGRVSMTGGQSVVYSGLGLPAPGNTSSSRLGMSSSFFAGTPGTAAADDGFILSLLSALAGGSFTLGQGAGVETRRSMTDVVRQEYANELSGYAEEIASTLRTSAKNLGGVENSTVTMNRILDNSRDDLDNIFGRMRNASSKAAFAAEAMEKHGMFPTVAEMGGTYGEIRAPSIKEGDHASETSFRRLKNSPFQGRVQGMFGFLTKDKPDLANLKTSYAHLNDARMLGPVMPMSGGAVAPGAVTPEERSRMIAAIQAKSGLAAGTYSSTEIRSAVALRAQKDAKTYQEAIEKSTTDIYEQSRDRRSPHPLAAKDGASDGRAYQQARIKAMNVAGGTSSAATALINPRTGRPFTEQEIADATRVSGSKVANMASNAGRGPVFLGMPSFPEQPQERKKRFGKVKGAVGRGVGRAAGAGGGFGLSGLLFGLSMLPGKLGQMAQSIMPVVFGLQALGMITRILGGWPTLLIAAAAGIYLFNKSSIKAAEEIADAAKMEAEARYGSAKAIEEYAEFTGRALPSAREFSRNNRQLISASGEAVKRFAEFYGQKGNRATQVINTAAMRSPEAGVQAAAIDVAQRAAIFGFGPADIAANIKAAADLIGADQVELKAKIQTLLAPNGQDITKTPLTVKARMEFLQGDSTRKIESIATGIDKLGKIQLPKTAGTILGTKFDYQSLKKAAGAQELINRSYSGGIGGNIMGAAKQAARFLNPTSKRGTAGYFSLPTTDVLSEFKKLQDQVQSASVQVSAAFTQEKESLALLNAEYADGKISKEEYDAAFAVSFDNFDNLESSTVKLVKELNKIDSSGELASSAIKDLGNQALGALKKTNPELFKKISDSLSKIDKNAQIDIYMGFAKGSLTLLDLAKIPDVLDKINGKTYTVSLKIIGESGLSTGGAGMLTAAAAQAEVDRITKLIKGKPRVPGALARQLAQAKKDLAAAKKAEKDAAKVLQKGNLDTDTGSKGGSTGGTGKFINPYEKEIRLLNKKRDALKEVNDELDRQNQYQMKQISLINQAAKAKMTGDYLEAASLQQQSMLEGAKFARESRIVQMDRIIDQAQERSGIVANTKKLAPVDRKLLKKLRTGSYGDIAALPKTPNVGFGATGPRNTAAVTGSSSVYNVTMNVTGSNAEEISTKVLAKIKLIDSKMNKTNRIPL